MIGIYGGTFDPIHNGHLIPAQDIKAALQLSEIRFIPNRQPPHRASPWLSVKQRLQLLKTAIQANPDFVIDEREIARQGKSYMVDTLISLKRDFPKTPLCLMLGMDALNGFRQWQQWEKILTLCHLVVSQRPGYSWSEMPDRQWCEPLLSQSLHDLKGEEAGRILLQSVSQIDVSSSDIRQKISDGSDVSRMMPDEVHEQLMRMTNDNPLRQ